ncbi:DNA/RNA nuclease SfsA [Planctomycetota bacterium]|nr:DNA/RNA nuclease SfsA [Planctomycetota bacterium]
MTTIKRPLKIVKGTLIVRRNRFLADVRLEDGSELTAVCSNTGTMKSCNEPGRPVILSVSDNPKRKYAHSWELIKMGSTWVNVNTAVPNSAVEELILRDALPELMGYSFVRREVKYGREGRSRIDLLLTNDAPPKKRKKDPEPGPRCEPNGQPDCYVEVKNTSLRVDNYSAFPDAKTERGQKHLRELMDCVEQGYRAANVFFVGRTDTDIFRPADEVDPIYGKLLREAVEAGVEVYPLQVKFTPTQMTLVRVLPIEL